MDAPHQPHHVYLPDGRLLTWFHRPSDGDVCVFQLTKDRDVGVKPIDTEVGLALLAEHGIRADGSRVE